MIKSILSLLLIAASVFSSEGKTFEIQESPMFKGFGGEESVDIEKIQEEQLKKIKQYVNAPPPVRGIKEADEEKSFYYDPIYQVKEEIKTLDGKIIAKKGELVNPMDTILCPLPDLIFFDGTNPDHIQWAKNHTDAKWILIKGSPLKIEEETDHITFFDQMGIYCAKFGIERVPAKVSREGNRILIQEIPCESF